MTLAAHAEVLKLTRELQAEPGSLDGLATLDPEDLRRLRGMVGDALHDAHRGAFQRAAAASALLPTPLTARLAQSLMGPYLAARIAAEMPPDRSVRLAAHLEVEFLADICLSLDPARVADTVRQLPDDRVLAVGVLLLDREEYVTLGKFVDVVSPSVLDDMSARITDPRALLRIATAIEARHRLDDLVRRVDDDRLLDMVTVAAEDDQLAPLLTLLTHLVPLLADLDDEHLARVAEALRRVPDDQQRELAAHLLEDDDVDVEALLDLLDRVPQAADLPVVVALRSAWED